MELLLITLIGVGGISFLANKRDLMAPTNMVCAVFIIGALFAWYQRPVWQYDYSQKTTYVIASSIGCMIVGAVFANMLVSGYLKKKKLKTSTPNDQEHEADIPKKSRHWYESVTPSIGVIIAVTVFAIATSWLYYKDIYENVIRATPNLAMSKFTLVGQEVKKLSLEGQFRFQKYNAWFQYLRKGFAYSCIFLYLKLGNEKRSNFLKKCYLLLPVAPFLFCCYVTGIRTEFIFLIAYTVTIFGVMLLKNGKVSLRQIVKTLLGALTALGILMVIWGGTYLVRHKITRLEQIDTTVKQRILNEFAIYSGGGIVELDEYLKNPPAKEAVFGAHTLQNVYSKLNRLGGNYPDVGLCIYKLTKAGKLNTNIFTAFRRYIEDYGMRGNYLICLLLGLSYTAYYRLTQIKKENPLYLMTYAALIFPLFVMASEDYFFMYLVDTTPLYICGFQILSWILLCNADQGIHMLTQSKKANNSGVASDE